MIIKIHHQTRYTYDDTVIRAIQRLALTPLDMSGQKIDSWEISAPGIEEGVSFNDAYGNQVHLCTQNNAVGEMLITASGTVTTTDNNGVIGKLANDPPARLFMRNTVLSRIDESMTAFADDVSKRKPAQLECLHELMQGLHKQMDFKTSQTNSATTGAEAFAAGHGVCQDFTHIFIAMCRHMGMPARYVTGYLMLADEEMAEAQHAWAEVWLPELGWVGFDAANSVCPNDRYVRLSCGLDAASAAPIKGLRIGAANESLAVQVDVQQIPQ